MSQKERVAQHLWEKYHPVVLRAAEATDMRDQYMAALRSLTLEEIKVYIGILGSRWFTDRCEYAGSLDYFHWIAFERKHGFDITSLGEYVEPYFVTWFGSGTALLDQVIREATTEDS